MSNVQPIRPDQVGETKIIIFPDAVLESFNEIIAQNYCNGQSHFKKDDAVALMESKGLLRNEIYEKHWLDVEDVYRAAGWKVEYDQPAYCETYAATFTFIKKKK